MLEQQLLEAREARHKRLVKVTIVIVSVTLICGVLLAGASYYFKNNRHNSNIPATAEENTVPNTPPAAEITPPAETDTQSREDYLALLNRFQNEFDPALATVDLQQWQPERAEQLQAFKDAALDAFAKTQYDTALKELQSAQVLAESLIGDSQQQFTEALSAAMDYYEQDDYDNANQQISRALMLNTESEEAQSYSDKIERLSEALPFLEQAEIARKENNLNKELDAIEQVLAIMPERQTARDRKQQLQNQISLNNFQAHIDKAYAAIRKEDIDSVKRHLAKARAIYPRRAEIQDVAAALKSLEKEQRFTSYSSAALQAMREDDWLLARQQLQLALKEHPDDKTIKDLLNKSNTVIAIADRLDQYLNNPYRLSNSQVRTAADALLTEAEPYRMGSIKITSKSEALTELLQKMNNKVPVRVLSDNNTKILVRGVGVVGMTEDKTIELTPGRYKFEGKRDGYKSKLIEVLVPYDKSTLQLTVICDEPI